MELRPCGVCGSIKKIGKSRRCAECNKLYCKSNWQKLNSREYNYKRNYGITMDIYNSILEKQNYKCSICETHISKLSKPLFVDHDHKTKEIRGLLCIKCNAGLGMMGDSVEGLMKAINYLMKKE